MRLLFAKCSHDKFCFQKLYFLKEYDENLSLSFECLATRTVQFAGYNRYIYARLSHSTTLQHYQIPGILKHLGKWYVCTASFSKSAACISNYDFLDI